jgi:hypothetical protein
MFTSVALAAFQRSVAHWPRSTVVGSALKVIDGRGGGGAACTTGFGGGGGAGAFFLQPVTPTARVSAINKAPIFRFVMVSVCLPTQS